MSTAFGKYELHAKAGQGRLTVTWRARVSGTTRDVAVKQLLPHVGTERFTEDAKAAAALPPHANLVAVLDHGHVGPTHFFTTEWVRGQTLHAVLDRARKKGVPFLPTPVVLQIGISLCEGLHHLHGLKAADGRALKLVHREVGTDAVLLGYDGQVKLTDFLLGPSRAAVKSELGVLKGKFPYFSPEQARGEVDLDRRSDVFAVGAVLYHLVCGRRPFEGELIDALPMMLKGDFIAPRSIHKALPADVEAAIVRALAPTRDARFGSANDLEAALKAAMDPAFTPDRMGRFVEWLFSAELAGEGKVLAPDPAFEKWLKAWLVDLAPSTIQVASLAEAEPRDTSKVPAVGPASTAVTANVLRPVFTPPDAAAVTDEVVRPGKPTSPSASAELAELPPPMPDFTPPMPPSVAAPDAKVDTAQTAFALPPVGTRPPAKREPIARRNLVPVFAVLGVLVLGGVLLAIDARGDDGAVGEAAELVVTSTPMGATVFLDGREQPSRTPFTLKNVTVEKPHTVIVDLPGHVRWKTRVTVIPGANKVHAILQSAPQ